MKDFTIGALSNHTAVNIETIRYYERTGLIGAPDRSEGGHRRYDASAIERLTFIKRGRELGFSLGDIKSLLGLEDGEPTCREVMTLAQDHLLGVQEKIKDLKRMEKTLAQFVNQCEGGDDPDCPIINALSHSQKR